MEKKYKNNNVVDRSYFTRRLRRSGWAVDVVVDKFGIADKRDWMVVIARNGANVFITCNKNGTFSYYDALQFFSDSLTKNNINTATESMEVVATRLVEAGINEKHFLYGIDEESEKEDEKEKED